MPGASAVSTRPVPFGTCTSRPSIVTVTSSLTGSDPLIGTDSRGLTPGNGTGPARSRWHLGYRMMRVLIDRGHHALERGLAAERAAAFVDVRPELVPELRHVAGDGHGSRV